MVSEQRRKYNQHYYLGVKILNILNKNLPPEETQKLIKEVEWKYATKKQLLALRQAEEEAKRRYDFIYN
jgi:hypothetical protein